MLLEVVEHCFCFVVRCLVPWVGGIIISPDNFYDCLAELIDALLESAVHQGYLCRYFLRVERVVIEVTVPSHRYHPIGIRSAQYPDLSA